MSRTVRKATLEDERLIRLLAKAEPAIRLQFERMIAGIKNQWTLDYITQLLENGRLERAFTVLAENAARLSTEINRVYVSAGTSAADEATASLARAMEQLSGTAAVTAYGRVFQELGEHTITIGFDQVNHRAVAAMRANKLRLVQGFTQGQRTATQRALIQGIKEGLNPRAQAVLIRNSVGLTDNQQIFVNNYRNALRSGTTDALSRTLRDRRFDPSVRNAATEGRILSPAQIDKMTERYSENWRNYRAEVISRTEALRSVHEGDHEGWAQAKDRVDSVPGLKAELVRTWIDAGDDRVRDSHAEMNGQQVGLDEPFTTPGGVSLMYPGDPSGPPEETIQCRCAVSTTFRAE